MASYRPYVCVGTDALCEHQHPSKTGQLDVLWLMCVHAMLQVAAEASIKSSNTLHPMLHETTLHCAMLLCQISLVSCCPGR